MQRLMYEGIEYRNEFEMVVSLLNQANERLIRIDLGEFPNEREERCYIKFRLMHIERSASIETMAEVRSMYNSLWSQLYRLEHQSSFTHPYLESLIRKIKSGASRDSN